MKTTSLPEILTEDEILICAARWQGSSGGEGFTDWCENEIIKPNIDRINAALGQDNVPRYLAYCVEHIMRAVHLPADDPTWVKGDDPGDSVVCDFCNVEYNIHKLVLGGAILHERATVLTMDEEGKPLQGVTIGDDNWAMCPVCLVESIHGKGMKPTDVVEMAQMDEPFHDFVLRFRKEHP